MQRMQCLDPIFDGEENEHGKLNKNKQKTKQNNARPKFMPDVHIR